MLQNKFFVLVVTAIFANAVYPAGMPLQEINRIATAASEHFNNSSRAANSGDRYNACREAREALRLFHQIDPKDFPPQLLAPYQDSLRAVKNVVESMKGVC